MLNVRFSMKKIPLTHGKYAIVDDEDFEWLSKWKWHLSDSGYAHRTEYIRLGVNRYASKTIRMHRLINNTPHGLITDHINRKKLDNRRRNLRTADKSLNSLSRDKPRNNTSGHKGVYWESWTEQWRAELKVNCKKISLGRYDTIDEAIEARKAGEQRYLSM